MKSNNRFAFAYLFLFVLTIIWGGPLPVRAADTVIDVTRLMSGGSGSSLRFYDQNARLMISDVGLIFKPDGDHNTIAELQRAVSGEVVATVEFFPGYQWTNTVFGDVRPNGSGIVEIPGKGDYELTFKVNGKVATSFPFTVVGEDSDDPFNPVSSFQYRGQWEKLIYLKTSKTYTDHPVEVTFWTSALDLPSADGKGELMVKLFKDGNLLARNKRAKVVNKRSKLFAQYRMTLHEPVDNPNAAGFAMSRLLSEDGTYRLAMEIDGMPVRTFSIVVGGGKIAASPRSVLGYQPAHAYLAPRWIEMDDRNLQSYAPEEIYWLEAD